MKMLMMVGILGMLAGCYADQYTDTRPIIGPDGKQVHVATCYDDHAGCIRVMGEFCGSEGYQVFDYDKNSQSEGRGYNGAWRQSTTNTEVIMFRCGQHNENNQTKDSK